MWEGEPPPVPQYILLLPTITQLSEDNEPSWGVVRHKAYHMPSYDDRGSRTSSRVMTVLVRSFPLVEVLESSTEYIAAYARRAPLVVALASRFGSSEINVTVGGCVRIPTDDHVADTVDAHVVRVELSVNQTGPAPKPVAAVETPAAVARQAHTHAYVATLRHHLRELVNMEEVREAGVEVLRLLSSQPYATEPGQELTHRPERQLRRTHHEPTSSARGVIGDEYDRMRKTGGGLYKTITQGIGNILPAMTPEMSPSDFHAVALNGFQW
jgi:hypothetical protein